MAVKIAGSLVTAAANTPVDINSRVATLDDVANMSNPCLGGIFYCVADGKHYKITALKAKTVGAASVPNAAVDTYEELSGGGGVAVWTGTQAEYESIGTYDDNTLYLIRVEA